VSETVHRDGKSYFHFHSLSDGVILNAFVFFFEEGGRDSSDGTNRQISDVPFFYFHRVLISHARASLVIAASITAIAPTRKLVEIMGPKVKSVVFMKKFNLLRYVSALIEKIKQTL